MSGHDLRLYRPDLLSRLSPNLLALVLEANPDHSLSCKSWAAFLLASDPDAYGNPEPAVYPTPCLPGSAGKIEAMTIRLERGLSLWHPMDGRPEQCDALGQPADPGRNGRVLGKRDLVTLRHHQALFATARQRRLDEAERRAA